MNAYYNDFRNKISDSRIIEGYFEEIPKRESVVEKLVKKAISLAKSTAVRRFAKPISLSLSLVAVAAVIGAIESGRMGIFAGLLLGGLIIAIEALALGGIKKRS